MADPGGGLVPIGVPLLDDLERRIEAAPNALERPLAGMRVVEVSSFVAGPSGALTLGQLGAEIIRVDPLVRSGRH